MDPIDKSSLHRKIRWRIVSLLWIVSFLALIDRANLGYAALTMNEHLGLAEHEYGMGSSIFYAGYLFSQVPSVWIAQQLGASKALGLFAIAWGAIASSFAFMVRARATVGTFYALRVALGIAEGGFLPIMFYAISQWFSSSDGSLTYANAILLTSSPVAGMLGGLIAAAILSMDQVAGVDGWQRQPRGTLQR